MDDQRRGLEDDDIDEPDDDGSRGIWAAFERESARPLPESNEINVDTLKERLKQRARLRASRDDASELRD